MTRKFSAPDLVSSRSSGYTGHVMASYPTENGVEYLVKGVPDVRTGIAPEPRTFSEKALRAVVKG